MYSSSSFLNSKDDLPFPESAEGEQIKKLRRTIEKLEHDLFFLHVFLASEDFSEEACDFLEAHEDSPLPFKLYP